MKYKPFLLAANWKMNPLTIKEAERITRSTEQGIKGMNKKDFSQKVELVVFPPAIFLGGAWDSRYLKWGVQNVHWEPRGAFTGEIATRMAEDAGCKYVILGHSERRKYFGENDSLVNLKLRTVLRGSLNPIVCVGETKAQRESNQTIKVIKSQLMNIFSKVSVLTLPRIVVAYEPVWAISTMDNSRKTVAMNRTVHGVADDPNDVMGIVILIRKVLSEMFHSDVAEKVRVIYGGSVNGKNVDEFLNLDILDGFLVGSASISMFDFLPIIRKVYDKQSENI